jgi:hypothetical protein
LFAASRVVIANSSAVATFPDNHIKLALPATVRRDRSIGSQSGFKIIFGFGKRTDPSLPPGSGGNPDEDRHVATVSSLVG